tara:strand:+ start:94 stop:519 length:426 start_codon:yes stop_codon:yes gene_type:complete
MSEDNQQQQFALPSSFLLHFNDIDPQHFALVEQLNFCLSKMDNGVLKNFEPLFAEFLRLMAIHFEIEEGHMADLDYSGLDWHRNHHADCLERLQKLIGTVREQGYAGIRELRICFDDIIYDIVHADLKFGEFLDANGYSKR